MKLRSILIGGVCLIALAVLPATLFAAPASATGGPGNQDSAPAIEQAARE
jgi:hypothetical protein